MDETAKPLRIPLEMSVYADSHRVLQLIKDLVSGLVINRPEDPVQWLVSELKRPCEELPRVLLLGPPAVGKHTVATRLAAELRAVHLTTESLLNDQSEQSVQACTCLKDGQEIPVELLTALIQQRLREPDCFNRGWVLVGLPQSRLQALGLQRAGVLPEHVVLLEAPDDVLLERNRGRLIDPTTGEAYHQTYILPDNDDVVKRLVKGQGLSEKQLLACLHRYRCEVTGLRSAYKQTLKEFNSDQPHQDVYQQVLGFVQTRVFFRIPRVLLLGPPGSGKSLQAEQLCHKYNLINVCCSELLRAAAADGCELGAQIRAYLEVGRTVPDSLVLQILEQRLSRVDASRGWVLHDFPSEISQARGLQKTIHHPNRVFLLELSDEACLDRVSLRSTDPVSGNRFHSVASPAPNSQVQTRLQTRPSDLRESVLKRLQQFHCQTTGLKSVYPDTVHVDADQDPHSIFEILEKKLTTN